MPLPDAEAASAPAETDSSLSTASKDIPVQPAGSTVSNDNPEQTGNALFGVFDGHGGSTVAKFSGSTLHTRLQGLESYSQLSFDKTI
jgi:protein phosphatase 2C family protein 2/3